MIVGLDLDNTIIGYDSLFRRAAAEAGLAPPILADRLPGKKAVRDHVRTTHGDEAWQRLQAEVYGPRLDGAELLPGVMPFLREAARRGADLYVVSHKTRQARLDAKGTDLRQAALAWMENHGLFGPDTGLAPDRVFFEDTRAEKIARILSLACSVFVDDLEEVLADPALASAPGVQRILFDPHKLYPTQDTSDRNGDLRRLGSWREITDHVFPS